MGASALTLQFNSAFRAAIRPYFILPLTTFIHLSALRTTEGPQPSRAENISDYLGIFGLRWVRKGVLRKNIHRAHHNEIIEEQKAHQNLLIKG